MIDPWTMLRPRRRVVGMSAILLPFQENGSIDWLGFRQHVQRTAAAGLIPAINMDTGYGNLIDLETKGQALAETKAVLAGKEFVAGTFVIDQPGAKFSLDGYRQAIDQIHGYGGTPVICQSFGLTSLPNLELLKAYQQIAQSCDRFIGFELGQQFAPFGKIYDLEFYGEWLKIPQCIGAKHSSLKRDLEWQRLQLRDTVRPDFMVLTGNDLAIDMILYGSDYLLGLSTFAPDLFAKRDAYWHKGDAQFYELNDLLQYLGFFAFRPPVPAYKHSAAMFLKLRGQIKHDATHPKSFSRPDPDRSVLQDLLERLEQL